MIPKSRKGQEKEKIHRICHDKIHSTFTEKELAEYYHTWDRITKYEAIKTFVKWVSKKAPEYLDNPIQANRKKGKQKRH